MEPLLPHLGLFCEEKVRSAGVCGQAWLGRQATHCTCALLHCGSDQLHHVGFFPRWTQEDQQPAIKLDACVKLQVRAGCVHVRCMFCGRGVQIRGDARDAPARHCWLLSPLCLGTLNQGDRVRVIEPLQHLVAGLRRALLVAAPCPNEATGELLGRAGKQGDRSN